MAKPYGKAIWQSHMARPYGKAIWQSHMAVAAIVCGGDVKLFSETLTLKNDMLKIRNMVNVFFRYSQSRYKPYIRDSLVSSIPIGPL